MITYKFRLYPSRKIEETMLNTLNVCRRAYNFFLGELNSQKVIDKSIIQYDIQVLSACDSDYKQVYQKTLQMELHKLFSNLSGLSASKKKGRKIGSLRFKGKGFFKTFTYNQSGFKILPKSNRMQELWLSKIGNIPIRSHRKITGKIKQITIKREQSGKWFACVFEDGKKEMLPKTNKVVGIDLGLTDIIYDSDGKSINNPKHLKQKAKRLKHLSRLMSLKKKGSNNRNRFRIKLARQYEKVANARDDFLHKLSHYYVQNYDAIGMENFTITSMVHGRYAKSILDAGWGKLRQYIAYKAESAGKRYVPVDFRGTTQRCSQCGNIVQKGIQDREHKCVICGFEAERDFNSALEIRRLCSEKIGQELPESTHLEMRALPVMATFVCEK